MPAPFLAIPAMAFVLSCFVAFPAFAEPGARGKARHQPFLTRDRTTVSLTGGMRQSDMRWNIAGNLQGTNPNILSELTWKNIQTFEAQASVRHLSPTASKTFRGAWQLEGSVHGGLPIDGKVQDSDYLGDNRTLEFSRATADAWQGYTLGAQAAVGYRFNVAQRVKNGNYTFISLAPLAGYGWDREQFTLHGFRVNPPPAADNPYLDSWYNANWYGPFLGLEAEWEHNRHMLSVRGEYHDLTYYADADWNLRQDFMHDPSYEHESSNASGRKLALKYSYAPDSKYEFTVDVSHTEREASDGVDTTYFADGTIGQTKLNEVEQTTQVLRLGLTYGW